MKAVILAAGKGTRMRPLTEDTAKPMLPVAGKPILEHNIELIKDKVEEIIIIGGYRIEDIREHFSDPKIRIVEQEEALGTAHAALQAKEFIDSKTVIMNGDDIYGKDAAEALKQDSAVLAARADNPEEFGVFKMDGKNISGLVEKPDNPPSDLVNIGFYVVQPEFFNLLEEVQKSERGEYEITDAINEYISNHDVKMVETDRWIPCSYPVNLLEANLKLLSECKVEDKNGDNIFVEENASATENSKLQENVLVKSGSKIEDAEVRDSVIHSNSTVKGDISNTVIFEDAEVPEDKEISNSIVMSNNRVVEVEKE